MPVVDIKGVGKAQFPDNMPIDDIRNFLRNKYSQRAIQGQSDILQPVDNVVAPYEPSLVDKMGSGIASGLTKTGLISDNYRAQQIGKNISTLGEFLPGIGDATAGDEFGRAVAEGDNLGMAMAGIGAIPLAGDAVKNLYKTHNITTEGLKKAKELGGIPVPSLAIAGKDEGFDSFGDISLVGDKFSFSKDPTFASDVYSPRFPQSKHDISEKALFDESDKIHNLVPDELKSSVNSDLYLDRIAEDITRLESSQSNRAAFLKEIGEDIDPSKYKSMPDKPKRTMPNYFDQYFGDNRKFINRLSVNKDEFSGLASRWFDEFPELKDASPEFFDNGSINQDGRLFVAKILKGEIMKDEAFRKGAVFDRVKMTKDIARKIEDNQSSFSKYLSAQEDRLSKGRKFTKWNPDTATTKKFDFNLDNAVKLMKGTIRGGEGFNYGVGSIRAQVAPKLTSIKQIQDRRGQIVGEDQMTMVKEGFESRLDNLYDEIKDKWAWQSDPSMSDFSEGIQNAAKGDFGDFKNLTNSNKKELQSFFDELANAPTNYFEIKPQRAVNINEFYGAAVPEGTSKSVIDDLKSQGLQVETYKPEQRKKAINKLNVKSGGNIFFSGAGAAILYNQLKEPKQDNNTN